MIRDIRATDVRTNKWHLAIFFTDIYCPLQKQTSLDQQKKFVKEFYDCVEDFDPWVCHEYWRKQGNGLLWWRAKGFDCNLWGNNNWCKTIGCYELQLHLWHFKENTCGNPISDPLRFWQWDSWRLDPILDYRDHNPYFPVQGWSLKWPFHASTSFAGSSFSPPLSK